MQTISITASKPSKGFVEARESAVAKAEESIEEPVIIAWKDDTTGRFAPEMPGGKSDRWHDYGENYGGELELDVDNDYHFIFASSADFDKPDINMTSIPKKEGGYLLCLNDVCTEEDRQQFGAPYGGGLGDG
jgi:hypothetical protein